MTYLLISIILVSTTLYELSEVLISVPAKSFNCLLTSTPVLNTAVLPYTFISLLIIIFLLIITALLPIGIKLTKSNIPNNCFLPLLVITAIKDIALNINIIKKLIILSFVSGFTSISIVLPSSYLIIILSGLLITIFSSSISLIHFIVRVNIYYSFDFNSILSYSYSVSITSLLKLSNISSILIVLFVLFLIDILYFT